MELKGALIEAFVKYVVPVLFTGLATILGIGFAKLFKLVDAKAGESKIAMVGAKVLHLGEVAVKDLEATLKPMLAEACKDGVLTRAEFQTLREAGIGRLKMLLGDAGIKELGDVLGIFGDMALHAYLGGVVEKQVAAIQSEVPPADPLPSTPGGLPGVVD